MIFGAAMTLHDRQKFAEGSQLASVRDCRNNSLLWKKVRSVANQQYATVEQLQKVQSVLANQRRRILGGLPPVPVIPSGFPFKIYNISNASATAEQVALFTTSGLDINNLTFQVRNGLVGARYYISPSENFNVDSPVPQLTSGCGNSEVIMGCQCTDGGPNSFTTDDFYYPESSNTGSTVVLDDTAATLIYGVQAGSPPTPLTQFNQVALNYNPTQGVEIGEPNYRNAAFWLEIVDDYTSGFYVNLWGRMFSSESNSTRTNNPFPIAANIIPIGHILTCYPSDTNGDSGKSVSQYVSGNLVNRFPPGTSTMRGRWTELFAGLPSGATNLIFWPGDIVVNDSAYDGTGFYGVFQFVGATASSYIVSQTPLAGSYWQQVGCSDA